MNYLKLVLPLILVLSNLLIGCHQPQSKPSTISDDSLAKMPNIVFILADDWSYPHASIYGDQTIKTPNFDWLANQGVLFNNAYTAAPSCTPSRAAILTGRYPHSLNEGANLWSTLPISFANYAVLLEKAGYDVVFQEKGWGPGNYEKGGYQHNPAGREIKNFDHFLEHQDLNKPFFLWYGSRDPHRPYQSGLGAKVMDTSTVKLPEFYPNNATLKNDMLDYYYEVQRLDYDISKILFRLKRRGILDNTLIIVTSDNGMPFPRAKANLYDLGTKVPLAIYWGNQIQNGLKTNDFVNLIDLAPTFLDVAGLPIPESMHGKSLLPLLQGKTNTHRNRVFLDKERHAFAREDNKSYPMRAIRDHQYLLIHNLIPNNWPAGNPIAFNPTKGFIDIDGSPSKDYMILNETLDADHQEFYQLSTNKRPEFELYDIKADPYQTKNLAQLPQYSKLLQSYKDDLLLWRKDTKDPTLEYPTYFESFEYFGKPHFRILEQSKQKN